MSRLPAIFFGHGNPMNAVRHNEYTHAWSALGASLPRPRAVLCISAHWFVPETGVTVSTAPRTIHDFGGFPRELYEVRYPAPGDPVLAARVREMLAPVPVALDDRWGLDHGAWSVLMHVFPAADVPIVQLSIDQREPASYHYEIGRRLAPLRDEGVLIVGSGNLVHNLHAYAWGREGAEPYTWALRFEQDARDLLMAGDQAPLVDYDALGPDARLAIPTPDHYLPLLYVIATRQRDDAVTFPVDGIDGGSVSMLAVRVG
ncbi:MAG: 4,5-DOPA dioxygenase extradiol [Vicinamibacterales bacterium]